MTVKPIAIIIAVFVAVESHGDESQIDFKRERFSVDGRTAFVMRPPVEKVTPIPWVLYAPTLGAAYPGQAEEWMFRQFLEKGIAIAGVDVGESYGNPEGRKVFNQLHSELVGRGFDKKACLLGRSRGGLMLYCWAAENPEKVRCISGIYPVCNLESYPGLKRASSAYGMTTEQLKLTLPSHNPIDRLLPLATAKVPIYHIHGDSDTVVPLDKNSDLIAKRYSKLGGKMELNVAENQGHNMWFGFFKCQELVDFLIQNATRSSASKVGPPTASFWDAARAGDIETVRLHLAAGSDANAKDVGGWVALHGAAGSGHREIVELLLANGAKTNVPALSGKTALDYAVRAGHKKTVELLRLHGGKLRAELEVEGK